MKDALLTLMILVQPAFAESISSEGDAQVYQTGGDNYYGDRFNLEQYKVPEYDFKKTEKLKGLLEIDMSPEQQVNHLKKEGWCEYEPKKGFKRSETFENIAIVFEEQDGTGRIFKSEKPITRQELRALKHSGDVHTVMNKCEKESVPSA